MLAKVRDDAADVTVGLGRRLLQRIFGTRGQDEALPEPVADVVADPADEDAVAALRLAVRKALAADAGLQGEVRDMLAQAGVSVMASGERSIAAQVISGVAVTGNDATVTRLPGSGGGGQYRWAGAVRQRRAVGGSAHDQRHGRDR